MLPVLNWLFSIIILGPMSIDWCLKVLTWLWSRSRRCQPVMCESGYLESESGSESRHLESESNWIRILPFFLEPEISNPDSNPNPNPAQKGLNPDSNPNPDSDSHITGVNCGYLLRNSPGNLHVHSQYWYFIWEWRFHSIIAAMGFPLRDKITGGYPIIMKEW